MRPRWSAFIAVLLLPAAVSAHPFENLRRQIVAEVQSGTVPAFAIAVLHNGRIVWEEGFGGATPHTPFSLASVSKPITATALMVLVQRGEIDLDRSIHEYLGGVCLTGRAGDPAEATVRRVASHTAGLPLHFRFYSNGERRSSVEETVARYGVLVHPPGETFHYSNLGYRLLERTLEVVSGEPLDAVLQREVFDPLGMRDTALITATDEELGAVARRTGMDRRPLPFYYSDHPGGSDVYASAHDLVRFAALHLGTLLPDQTEILSRRTRHLMRRSAAPRNGHRDAYGIGWVVEDDGVFGHTGGMPGTSTALYLLPQRNVAVAALAASSTELPQRIARQVLARFRVPSSEFRVRELGTRNPEPGTQRKRPPRRLIGEWTGSVLVDGVDVPLAVTVARDGSVRARLNSAEARALFARFGRGSLHAMLRGLELPSDDLRRDRYLLHVKLQLEQDRLRGTATAHGRGASSLPFALTHWVDLGR